MIDQGTQDPNALGYGGSSVTQPPNGFHYDASKGQWVGLNGTTVWDPTTGAVTNTVFGPTGTPLPQAANTTNPDQAGLGGTNPTNTPPTPSSGGGGGGGSTGLGSLIAPFTETYTQPGFAPLPSTPTFTAPGFNTPPPFSYPSFTAPSPQDAMNDPGYQFRLGQGEQALQQSAAATGTLNTGGTLKDILGYGQDYASNEYQNVWNRDLSAYQTNYGTALNNYNTNYQTQSLGPYNAAFQNASASFAPQMTGYQTQAQNVQHQNDINQAAAWNAYLQSYTQFRNQQLDTFNKQYGVATRG